MTTPFKQTTLNATMSISVASQIEVLDLGVKLHAFKMTTSAQAATRSDDSQFEVRVEGLPEVGKTVVIQGVVDTNNLSKLLEGKPFEQSDLVLCEPELLEHYRLNGFNPDSKGKYTIFQARSETPYDDLLADPSAILRLVNPDNSSHTIFDCMGLPLPTPILISYMDGRMSNDTYDLKIVAETLLKRDDVQVFPRGKGWRDEPDYGASATTPDECVCPIPHYNVDEEGGRTHTIHFAYRPSVEDYRRIWAKCASYKATDPSTRRHEAVFDLDMLGLRAAGACLTETYRGEPVRKA